MNDPLPPVEYMRQAAEGLSVAVREFGHFTLDLSREQQACIALLMQEAIRHTLGLPLAHPTKADEE